MAPTEITEMVKRANLRGRGGARYPTGLKWSFVSTGQDTSHPKYLVANADEMEPGTFKDRLLKEGDRHQLIEGMIVAAYAIQADVAYIFLRGEYKLSASRLKRALVEAYDHHYLFFAQESCGWFREQRAAPTSVETGLLNSMVMACSHFPNASRRSSHRLDRSRLAEVLFWSGSLLP